MNNFQMSPCDGCKMMRCECAPQSHTMTTKELISKTASEFLDAIEEMVKSRDWGVLAGTLILRFEDIAAAAVKEERERILKALPKQRRKEFSPIIGEDMIGKSLQSGFNDCLDQVTDIINNQQ